MGILLSRPTIVLRLEGEPCTAQQHGHSKNQASINSTPQWSIPCIHEPALCTYHDTRDLSAIQASRGCWLMCEGRKHT